MDCEFTASVMQSHHHRIQLADGSFQGTAPSCLWVGAWVRVWMGGWRGHCCWEVVSSALSYSHKQLYTKYSCASRLDQFSSPGFKL